ncbi:4Fe-4S dicluster domain-containing protein [Candidatus Borrarchaeum sp.]|uniref:4Fe-4S dicluster domain-containing protein n=1 Tax=Candidatus Borrarchaeum sp. TaxID=2846742 RepID=UPI00257C2AF2|nr:4Fe-4S dicluster domain-containing protein [Candidatus Borrarchaeum sp.]
MILMSSTISEFVKKLGADLVGIAHVKEIKDERIKAEIKSVFDDARTLILIGRRLEHLMIDKKGEESANYQITISKTLKLITQKLVGFIFRSGFNSKLLLDPEKMSDDQRINIKKLAESAGLGQIGFNNLLLTPEFGARVLIAALVTDALLEPSKRIESPICLELKGISCKKCADACPQLAISFTGRFYESKCLKQLSKDIELYQSYYCTLCITSCPVGHPDSSEQ